MANAQVPRVRQNYHPETEAAVNLLINQELHASNTYLSVAFYFSRYDVALKHFAHYFHQQSREAKGHARKLMQLQNQRGACLHFRVIRKPERDNWESGFRALGCALRLQKRVNQCLLELHHLASDTQDAHLYRFLQTHYLHGQVQSIKELGDHLTNLRNLGAPESSLAEYLLDQVTLGDTDRE